MAPSPQIFRQNISPSPRDLLIPPLPTTYHFSSREIWKQPVPSSRPPSLSSPQAVRIVHKPSARSLSRLARKGVLVS